ncbi:hypothetical protein J6590_073254 [Homalodisca vitripennis]|nr:hypothetical protein J6590_073254 [Homalodisca vitripennis]
MFGIDLGTSYIRLAQCERGNVRLVDIRQGDDEYDDEEDDGIVRFWGDQVWIGENICCPVFSASNTIECGALCLIGRRYDESVRSASELWPYPVTNIDGRPHIRCLVHGEPVDVKPQTAYRLNAKFHDYRSFHYADRTTVNIKKEIFIFRWENREIPFILLKCMRLNGHASTAASPAFYTLSKCVRSNGHALIAAGPAFYTLSKCVRSNGHALIAAGPAFNTLSKCMRSNGRPPTVTVPACCTLLKCTRPNGQASTATDETRAWEDSAHADRHIVDYVYSTSQKGWVDPVVVGAVLKTTNFGSELEIAKDSNPLCYRTDSPTLQLVLF